MSDIVVDNNLVVDMADPNNELSPVMSIMDDMTVVNTTQRCQSKNARKLKIFNLAHNIKVSSDYSIGGTYYDTEPDFWFYFTTSNCLGTEYLFNLFVCHRRVGNFGIGVANSNTVSKAIDSRSQKPYLTLSNELAWHTFKTVKPNQSHFIKTFCFPENCFKTSLNPVFTIPIAINTNPPIVNSNIIKTIKLKHDFSGLLSKELKTDLILQSASQKEYPAHKMVLAAHSPILREIIKNLQQPTLFIDISDNEMEILMEYLCSGAIKEIKNKDCLKLLELAARFELNNMSTLVQYALETKLCVDNAVEIAQLTERYRLQDLQAKVFKYIALHPEVMDTKGWSNLEDVNLTKKLFQYIHKSKTD